jgi:hypothetical protein
MRTSAGSIAVWLHAGYRRALVYCQEYRKCLIAFRISISVVSVTEISLASFLQMPQRSIILLAPPKDAPMPDPLTSSSRSAHGYTTS